MTLLVHIRIFPTVVAAFLVASFVCSATLAAEPKRILLIHSFAQDFSPWREYEYHIRAELRRQLPEPLEIFEVSLATARLTDKSLDDVFAHYLGALSARYKLDLVVAIGAPAANFFQKVRQQIFPTVPMIFTGVEKRRVSLSDLTTNDVAVPSSVDHVGIIDHILRLLPATDHVAVVTGNSPNEKFWVEAIRNELKPFTGRVTFTWLNELSFEEMLKRSAALPPRSGILFILMSVDAAGISHEGKNVVNRLHAVANAPIFSWIDIDFGQGIVGGPLIPLVELASQVARVADRILRGEVPSKIGMQPVGFGTPRYDWRELRRWDISESRLPPGSEIHFRDPTVWEQYRTTILAVIAAILLQAALITWLIYERWWRQAAESGSLELVNELARMNRFATAGELAASIAHEIRQPLAAIATFGSTGLIWLKKKVPDLDEVRNVLQNVVKESHRADDVIKGIRAMFRHESPKRRPVDLNELVQQVITITARTMDSNNIVLDSNLVGGPSPFVMSDPVQLQQVILNLVMNAVEAMSHAGHSPRMLRLRTEVDPSGNVLMRVIDSGPSVDPKVAEKMFQPFFTTKPGGMGMGLSICKTIIEAHGGSLTASPSNPHGMEFQIVLPHCRYP